VVEQQFARKVDVRLRAVRELVESDRQQPGDDRPAAHLHGVEISRCRRGLRGAV